MSGYRTIMLTVHWLTCLLLVMVASPAAATSTTETTSGKKTTETASKTTGTASKTTGTASKTTGTTSKTTGTTSKTTGTATHTVKVGPKESPHDFSPHSFKAAAGDVIVFQFYPRNHSVVKADYGSPCVPASGEIFYSGMFDNFSDKDAGFGGPMPTWSVTVNDTAPTFYYCTAIDSCMKNGMVGAINPNTSMTWESQHKRALSYPYMLVPGQSMPAEGNRPSSESGSSSSSSKLSGGAIAGIVIGCVAFIAVLLALFFALGRNRVYRKRMSSDDGRNSRTAHWALFGGHAGEEPTSTQKSDIGGDNYNQYPGDLMSQPASPNPTQHSFYSPPQQCLYPTYGGASSADSPNQQQHLSLNESVLGQQLPQSPYRQLQTEPSELEADNVRHELPGVSECR